MTRPMYLLAPLLALPLLPGCAGEEAAAGEVVIEVGTGEWRFEPLADGQEVRLVHGAQGGWHVWTSVRARDVEPDRVRLELSMRLADDPAATWDTSKIDVSMVPDGDSLAYLGYPFVVPHPPCVADRPLEISATLRDRGGRTGSDSCVVLVRYEPVEGSPTICE